MLPIGDSPRDPTHFPVGTLFLIALNVLVALALAVVPASVIGQDPMMEFGFVPRRPEPITFFTTMFVHAGPVHLAGNMLYLWIYGPNVERRLGVVAFLMLFLTAGVLGTDLYWLSRPYSPLPVVGASGAISGILGAYLVFYPLNHIRVVLPWFQITMLPAWIVLLFYVLVDNVWPFLSDQVDAVAHAAHLGGVLGGFGLAVVFQWLFPAADPDEDEVDPDAPLEGALQLWRQGMVFDAHDALHQLVVGGGADSVRAQAYLDTLEADPAYLRAASRRGR